MISGFRILVVEDDFAMAETLADILNESEAVVVGPISTVAEARQLIRNGAKVDAALLDLNLGDGSVTPLLEALRARSIPTLVYTGGVVPEPLRKRHPELTVLTKPVPPARLIAELRRATRNHVGSAQAMQASRPKQQVAS
jgi:DNA-binding response OmpR family regulator